MALLTGLVLLTGCTIGSLRVVPENPNMVQQDTQQVEQRYLQVYDPNALLTEALSVYAEQQQVEVLPADKEQAALVVAYQLPTKETAKDLSQDGGLVAVVAGLNHQEACYGVPFGSNVYGYLVDNRLLKALLGESFDQENLKHCSWQEWRDFVEAVSNWIVEPTAQTVKLNGKTYKLPAAKTDETQALQGVFTFSGANAYTGPILVPVMATHYKTAELVHQMKQEDTVALKGALQRLVEVIEMETVKMAGPEGAMEQKDALTLSAEQARQAFADGKALFYRTSASEAVLMNEDLQQNLVLIPMKFNFVAEDLGDGYTVEEIINQPVTVAAGWFTVSALADAKAQKEAQAFLVWAYTNETAKELLPKTDESIQALPDLSKGLSRDTRKSVGEQVRELIGAD